ncbi:PDR/VanB family oxidoreductase [Hydrogenophaga sp. PBL-H3]|uniref:PDR/VanB family oxidoreductase n=1 Tax=Hydrogenophaga sp. PBL-H3 TaxID=434010 RepID=UPI0013202F26|nr:PDR/VanB family oxidoreductase [Hydrogenophaga sp. PBL-H3]QHE75544.1 oxidoreductase [Hydrogenophaga sp. PBL-H3]QHE79970.1 oxidoreductase [Hydrogenophaga sp. PBL-H3]
MSTSKLSALVYNMRLEAPGVVSVEFRPATPDTVFPPHAAGSHIDLHLGNGLVRSYSLMNPITDKQRYVVGVLQDRQSRGGSKYVHEKVRVGDVLDISVPRNNFPLEERAQHSVLVAGGIGITPMLCMLNRLASLGRSAELFYFARSRRDAAFLQVLESMESGQLKVRYHFDDEVGASPDLPTLLAAYPADTHFYGCGPGPMLDAFQKACDGLGYTHVHLERFAAVEPVGTPTFNANGCTVELRRSQRIIQVPAGSTILDAMMDAGIIPSYSCKEGICGACETKVLAGEVDHRDSILTQQERAANKSMMICVSGCRSNLLVLDL